MKRKKLEPKTCPLAVAFAVSDEFGIPLHWLWKRTRTRAISWPRQVAMAVMMRQGIHPRRAAGSFAQNIDNANHAAQAVRDRLSSGEHAFTDLSKQIARIEARIEERKQVMLKK